MDIKTDIKRCREALGWSRHKLSRECGLAGDVIGKIERGDWDPSLETLRVIGRKLRDHRQPFLQAYEEFLGIALEALAPTG